MSKFDEAKKQFDIINAPYKPNKSYSLYGKTKKTVKKASSFWDTGVEYIPRVEYIKFKPRDLDETK